MAQTPAITAVDLDNELEFLTMADEPDVPRAPASLEVIQYQVGVMQSTLDRSLSSIDRTIERMGAELRDSLARQGDRLGSIEQQLSSHRAEIAALQSFRQDQEQKEREETRRLAEKQQKADDSSLRVNIWLELAKMAGASIVSVGTIVAVLAAVGVFH